MVTDPLYQNTDRVPRQLDGVTRCFTPPNTHTWDGTPGAPTKSTPSHARVSNKVKPPASPSAAPNHDANQPAQSAIRAPVQRVLPLSPETRPHAGMAKPSSRLSRDFGHTSMLHLPGKFPRQQWQAKARTQLRTVARALGALLQAPSSRPS